MNQLRDGSDDAAWAIVDRYGPHVFRAVRRKLNREIRSKFDSCDFVQAVWASFFTRPKLITDVETPDQLIALLAVIARNKVLSEVRRRLNSQAYNVRRDMPSGEHNPVSDVMTNNPSAHDVAIARERWRRLLDGEPDHCCTIVKQRLRGETMVDIAKHIGVNERTVRRTLKRLLAKLDG